MAKPATKAASKTSGKTGAKPAKRVRPAKSLKAATNATPIVQEPAPDAGPLEYHQVAALPTRGHGETLQVCLITTRETRRWTIPKGWPMRGRKDHRAAAIEAEQEAGLKGRIEKEPAGSFLYFKRRLAHFDLVRTTVYRLHVERTLKTWREQGQREIRWVPPHEASMMVEEPGLVALLAELS